MTSMPTIKIHKINVHLYSGGCLSLLVFFCLLLTTTVQADIRLVATTTVENSGLLRQLLNTYAQTDGEEVKAIIAGSGRALAFARAGDVDILLTHDPIAEQQFVNDGYGSRYPYMYNYFVIAGPLQDSAGVQLQSTVYDALAAIAAHQHLFVSRGDDSGTHSKEVSLWTVVRNGKWYSESGQGMAATLRIASELGGYVLADSATIAYLHSSLRIKVLYASKHEVMKNVYSLLLVNATRFPQVNQKGNNALFRWLMSDGARTVIRNWKVNGQQLFTPIEE